MDKDHIKNYFWKNGYVVLRNIYNDEQIQRYREFIKKNIEEIVGQGKKNWKGARKASWRGVGFADNPP